MDAMELVAVASLVASIIAAGYGALAWHRPPSPKPVPPPNFTGNLPECGVKLSEFLIQHHGKIVDLHVSFQWFEPDDASAPDMNYVEIIGERPEGRQYLVLDDGPAEEGVVTRASRYEILAYDRGVGAFASDPAGNGYCFLSGSFIPVNKGAGKFHNYGLLVQVEPVERAKLHS